MDRDMRKLFRIMYFTNKNLLTIFEVNVDQDFLGIFGTWQFVDFLLFILLSSIFLLFGSAT